MKITKNNSGISIVEVVVAIMIITVGMVGVLSLVIQNVEAQYINKNVLMASGLAQEGLELVRNVRDLNWLTPGNVWNQGLVGDGTYTIDYGGSGNKICIGGSDDGYSCTQDSNCDSNVCRPINMAINSIDEAGARLYVDSNGLYAHTTTATPTNFYRLITVADNTDYLDVKCTIRWKDGTQNHNYTAETYLYDWR